MGHKKVCLSCRLAFSRDVFWGPKPQYPCPHCGVPMLLLPHRFRPPGKNDLKAWKVVAYLVEHGYYFQHIYQEGLSEYHTRRYNNYVRYPKTMREAIAFVATHGSRKADK